MKDHDAAQNRDAARSEATDHDGARTDAATSAPACAPDTPGAPASAFEAHDHSVCIASTMAAAERVCAARGAQFTPLRRRVLEILLESHRPMGAYAVLDRLRSEGLGSQPPTVYRALDFLMEHGLAHKVRKLNAFAACCSPERRQAPQFLICTRCQAIGEIDDPRVTEAVRLVAEAAGFATEETSLELSGVCRVCAETERGRL